MASVWARMSSASKLTLVSVENRAFMTASSLPVSGDPQSVPRARATSAPVSSSWSLATSSVLPQTPLAPSHPFPPAVCSHWKQNIGMSDSISITSRRRRVVTS